MRKFFSQYAMIMIYILAGILSIVFLFTVIRGKDMGDTIKTDVIVNETTGYKEVTVKEQDFVVKTAIFELDGLPFDIKDYVKVTASDGSNLTKYVTMKGIVDRKVPGEYKVTFDFKWNGINYTKGATYVVKDSNHLYTFNGVIKTDNNKALRNAQIHLDSNLKDNPQIKNPYHYTVLTDANGNFNFKDVKAGPYVLKIGQHEHKIDIFKNTTKDFTIKTEEQFILKLNPNGGNGTEISVPFINGISQKLPKNTFTKSGHTFYRWCEYKDGSGNCYKDEEAIMDVKGTLYAIWDKIAVDTYTININLNGGWFDSFVPNNYNPNTETFYLPEPKRSNYTFLGWTGSNGTTPQKNVSIQRGSTGNKNFVANWEAETYEIYFYSNNPRINFTNNTQKATYGQYFNLRDINDMGNIKYYNFLGWNTKQDGSGSTYGNVQNVVDICKNATDTMNLYAMLKPIEYKITYNLDGGTFEGGTNPNPTSYNTEMPTIELKMPQKNGYVFKGWSTNEDNSVKPKRKIYNGTGGDLIFTAHFVKIGG